MMNRFQIVFTTVLACVLILAIFHFCYKLGWNAAIDSTPKGVLFSHTFAAIDELPRCANLSPCYPLKTTAINWRGIHKNAKGKILNIEKALPKKMSYNPYAR